MKRCPRCKTDYDHEMWPRLPLINRLHEHPDEPDSPMVQIRACPCGLALTALERPPEK